MTEYKKPKVYENWMPAHQAVWDDLQENLAGTGAKKMRLNQSALADRTGYCRKTVQRALAEFERCNLLNKTQSATGRGRHPTYQLNWTFYAKCASPLQSPLRYGALLRKGSPTWNKVMKNIREMVQRVVGCGVHGRVITGKIGALIANRSLDIARWIYRHARRLLYREPSIRSFYQWLRGKALHELGAQTGIKHTEDFLATERQVKAEAKQSWQQTDMPSLQDFDDIRQYTKAFAEWEEQQGFEEKEG